MWVPYCICRPHSRSSLQSSPQFNQCTACEPNPAFIYIQKTVASAWIWTNIEISSMTLLILQRKQCYTFPHHMDIRLETCARLQNVPIKRRHSRKSVLNIAKHNLRATVAFSKLNYFTDMKGRSFLFMQQVRKGCSYLVFQALQKRVFHLKGLGNGH